jgi:hypothetical protein
MLFALLLVSLFYAILAILPADHLKAFRMVGAVPVGVIMFAGFFLLAVTVDGRPGFKQMLGEARKTLRELPDILHGLWSEIRG